MAGGDKMSFDKQAVAKIIAGYGEDAREFIQLTLNDADTFMVEITTAVGQGDAAAAGLNAHSLKSIMRQIGIMDVGDAAYEIEKTGKAGKTSECEERLPILRALYEEAKNYLSTLL